MKLSWIFVILLLLLVATFSVQNAELMTVRFIGWQFDMSAALVIQVAAVIGAVVGLLVGAYSGRRSRANEVHYRRPTRHEQWVEPEAPVYSNESVLREPVVKPTEPTREAT